MFMIFKTVGLFQRVFVKKKGVFQNNFPNPNFWGEIWHVKIEEMGHMEVI